MRRDGTLDAQKLAIAKAIKPAGLTAALTPVDSRMKADPYAHIKEKWLMEKFLLEKGIERSNQKLDLVQQVLSVGTQANKASEAHRGSRVQPVQQ